MEALSVNCGAGGERGSRRDEGETDFEDDRAFNAPGRCFFVLIVANAPTLGHVFYIGSFRVDAHVMRLFYKGYLAVMMLLLVLSFINWKHK